MSGRKDGEVEVTGVVRISQNGGKVGWVRGQEPDAESMPGSLNFIRRPGLATDR